MSPGPFDQLPPPPARASAAAVMARLAEGLAFRYRWATEDLAPGDGQLRPAPACRTLQELMEHVFGLVRWLDGHLQGDAAGETPQGMAGLRQATLERLSAMALRLREMDDGTLERLSIRGRQPGEEHPFWNMIHGPLADALTHVGQITAWRRVAGRPAPAADVFRGRPPRP